MVAMQRSSIVLVVPTFVFSAILIYLVGWNVYISFTNWSFLNPSYSLVGFNTFSELFKQQFFANSLVHSLELSVVVVAAGNALGILFAGLLYFLRSNVARSVYLSVLILPLAVSMAVNGIVWLWLYNINLGVDWVLTAIGLPRFPWLASTSTMFPSLMVVAIWAYAGIPTLFYLAGYMNIDRSVVEAARLDGAWGGKILFRILVPNSLNAFVVSTALLFLFSFRIFSLPYILAGARLTFSSRPQLSTCITSPPQSSSPGPRPPRR